VNIEFHPCLDDFDPLTDAEIDSLRKSLKKHGCKVPLLIWKPKEWLTDTSKLMDGKHRHGLCQELGIPFNVTVFDGTEKEAVALAHSLNQDRRHRPVGYRAMQAAKELQEGGVSHGGNRRSSVQEPSSALETVAEQHGVGKSSVKDAKKVLEHGTEPLQEAVADGTVTVSDAAKVASEPAKVQNQAVKKVRKGEAKTVAAAVEEDDEQDVIVDDDGCIVPAKLRQVFIEVSLFRSAAATMARSATVLKAAEHSIAYQASDREWHKKKGGDRHVYSSSCLTAQSKMNAWRPALVCKGCKGDGCKDCGDKGFLTVDDLPEDKK
jgi:hypothetical protein